MDKFVEIRVKAVSGTEAYLRSCIGAFCVELDPTLDEVNDVKTAVSEAVTNCVVHAYRGREAGEIRVFARIEESTLYIDISDDGCGIEDPVKARQAFFTTAPSEERSGLGFTVMETFMDRLTVKNNERGGVTVSMEKEFDGIDSQHSPRQKGELFAWAQ